MIQKCFAASRWLILITLFALIPQRAYACSCVPPAPPAEAFANAEAVFAGKVIHWSVPNSTGSSADPIHVTFNVSTVWKGPASRILAVQTASSGASCGYGFVLPEEYLVYAYGAGDDLEVSLCSRTRPLADAAEDLAELGAGEVPASSAAFLPTLHSIPCQRNLADTLEENSGFSILLQALEAADLLSVLETSGPFTLFAPTDAAFANLPAGALEQLLANPHGQLTQILLFHLVPGRLELDDLENGQQLTTQQGKAINVERDHDCHVRINGARILTPNIAASNGIIHAIDTVILPPPD